MKLRKILIPLDGSRLAETALGEAIQLSGARATLVLLRAAEAPRVALGDPVQAQVAVVREAQAYLDAVAERARAARVLDVETAVWYGPAAESIVEAARTRSVDLIVMSSHGRSGLGRMIFGSVTETVMRGTTTPILVIRPDDAPIAAIRSTGARPAALSRV